MIRKLTIAKRVALLVGVFVVFLLALAGAFVATIRQVSERAGEEAASAVETEVRHKIKVATHSMAGALSKSIAGAASPEEAEEAVRAMVADVRFEDDKSGYFFVYRGTRVVTVAIKPELTGKDLRSAKDTNGVRFVEELDKAAAAGGGFVDYVFDKPGVGSVPKVSYAELIPGTKMWVGTGVYLDNVATLRSSVQESLAEIAQKALVLVGVLFGSVLAFLVLPLSVRIATSVIGPVRGARDAMRNIASGEGDLTQRLDDDGDDELSQLASAFNEFLGSLQVMVRGLATSSDDLAGSASSLTQSSQDMSESARQIQGRSQATTGAVGDVRSRVENLASSTRETSMEVAKVAATTQELSANTVMVDRGASEATMRIDSVAAALEELSTSFQEVARSSADSANASQVSQNRVEAATTHMQKIRGAAGEIGKIVDLINDVADQTNLLALNATIEAASAGDAGKGFAVVASEVKTLADQTAKATDEIARRVEAMRSLTQKSGSIMHEIATCTQDVNRLNDTIAAAAEEQTATLQELTMNLGTGAQAVKDISDGISQVTESAGVLAESSAQLAEGAEGMAVTTDSVAESTTSAAGDLQVLSSETDRTVQLIEGVVGVAQAVRGHSDGIRALVLRFRT